MKQIFSLLLAGLFFAIFADHASAQGCVAIRSTGGICTMEHGHTDSIEVGIEYQQPLFQIIPPFCRNKRAKTTGGERFRSDQSFLYFRSDH